MFVLGAIIFSVIGASAATILNGTDVQYTGNKVENASNIQDAIDGLYDEANTWVNPNDMGTPTRYAYGTPTTSSPTTPPSGKNVYVGLYADNQYGVCIKRNGTQHCFRYDNWIAEAKHVQKVFSDISCYFRSTSVSCEASDFSCYVYSSGRVLCDDNSADSYCSVSGDGSVYSG